MGVACARTWIAPFGIVSAEQIENALAPPPDGSTATKKCMTFNLNSETHTQIQKIVRGMSSEGTRRASRSHLWSRSIQTMRSAWRCSKAVTSSSRYIFSLPSAEIPIVSRNLRTQNE